MTRRGKTAWPGESIETHRRRVVENSSASADGMPIRPPNRTRRVEILRLLYARLSQSGGKYGPCSHLTCYMRPGCHHFWGRTHSTNGCQRPPRAFETGCLKVGDAARTRVTDGW